MKAKERDKKLKKGKNDAHKKDRKREKKAGKPDPAESQRLTPYLLYNDVGQALDWLRDAFGFIEYGHRFDDADGTVRHASMRTSKKGEIFMLGCPGSEYRNPRSLGNRTHLLYVNVDDVDQHFARAEKAGAEIVEPPTDTFYGDRRYTAEDPEGHQWAFAQHVRDVPDAEMSEAMQG